MAPPVNYSGQVPDKRCRKSTRSVSTLTPSQLARKRANDRKAQRAIRARQKRLVEHLEGKRKRTEKVHQITIKFLKKEVDNINGNQSSEHTAKALLWCIRRLEEECAELYKSEETPTADVSRGQSAQPSPKPPLTAQSTGNTLQSQTLMAEYEGAVSSCTSDIPRHDNAFYKLKPTTPNYVNGEYYILHSQYTYAPEQSYIARNFYTVEYHEPTNFHDDNRQPWTQSRDISSLAPLSQIE
ncbi:hypothetical protein NQ176_g4851 [Zarea fungicola]|uniref:Uncharacterized protein n=1 Tax=Zarea fungicola TaxID=93591 RepID=A0ACC1NDX2_9HYPO|nr:hypothetical protein NQ176_g4851 [Lecanicillium fungicola]